MNYLEYINNYGDSLEDGEKIIARNLFNDLLERGWNLEKIFHGIRLLKQRPISQYKGLFYFQDFIKEIDKEIETARELMRAPYERKIVELSRLYAYGYDQIPEELKQRCDILDNKLCGIDENGNTTEYSKAELEGEVNYLYEKCIVEPLLLIPLSELEKEDARARRQYYKHKRGLQNNFLNI